MNELKGFSNTELDTRVGHKSRTFGHKSWIILLLQARGYNSENLSNSRGGDQKLIGFNRKFLENTPHLHHPLGIPTFKPKTYFSTVFNNFYNSSNQLKISKIFYPIEHYLKNFRQSLTIKVYWSRTRSILKSSRIDIELKILFTLA